MFCEYCSKPFTVDEVVSILDLKVKYKNERYDVKITTCSSCNGQLAKYPYDGNTIEMPEGAVELYKVKKYKFPKSKNDKTIKEQDLLKVKSNIRPKFFEQSKKKSKKSAPTMDFYENLNNRQF
jgi:hypothetical protein